MLTVASSLRQFDYKKEQRDNLRKLMERYEEYFVIEKPYEAPSLIRNRVYNASGKQDIQGIGDTLASLEKNRRNEVLTEVGRKNECSHLNHELVDFNDGELATLTVKVSPLPHLSLETLRHMYHQPDRIPMAPVPYPGPVEPMKTTPGQFPLGVRDLETAMQRWPCRELIIASVIPPCTDTTIENSTQDHDSTNGNRELEPNKALQGVQLAGPGNAIDTDVGSADFVFAEAGPGDE